MKRQIQSDAEVTSGSTLRAVTSDLPQYTQSWISYSLFVKEEGPSVHVSLPVFCEFVFLKLRMYPVFAVVRVRIWPCALLAV